MTEQKHIQAPNNKEAFCGKEGQNFAPLEALEEAQPGEVCPVCLGQVMELEREGPYMYTAYVWPTKAPRVLSETFSHVYAVHAYRLTAARLLEEVGDSLKDFQYTQH